MKKSVLVLGIGIVALVLTGCESKKDIETNKENIKNYVKDTISRNWTFDDKKLLIDNDYTVTIVLYNVDDWVSCVNSSEQFSELLKNNLKEDIKLKKIYYACKSNEAEEINSYVEIDDISNINMNNYINEVKALDSSKNIITEKYETAFTRLKNEYIAKCNTYDYEEIFRYSNDYEGRYAKFTGEVIQVLEENGNYALRINVTYDDGWYDDTIFVSIPSNSMKGRILEDDIVSVYGKLAGLYEYESIFGEPITIPALSAQYIDLVE